MVKISSGLPDKEMAAMELGLAHSLSRYKLKFSPDKIDTMIVQVSAIRDRCWTGKMVPLSFTHK